MGAAGGALGALSDAINKRAERERIRQQSLDDEQRQNQIAMIDQAVISGNLTPEQIQGALEQKKKLYPKEVHPMIDKMGEVLGHVFKLKKNSQPMSEQSPVAGVSSTSVPTANPDASQSTPPAATAAPTATNTPAATPSAVPSSMASILATANPNPVTKARTAAQASLAGNEVIQSDRNTRAQKVIDDLKASGSLTPQAEQAIRMEAQGFTVPASMLRSVMGRQMQPDVKDGVLMGVKNPETNEYYTDPKTMPAEAKAIWDTATAGLAGKEAQAERKQQVTFDHQLAIQRQAFNDALAAHDYKKAKDAVDKSKDILSDATDRRNTMDENLKDMVAGDSAGKPNQQAMLSLVANHLGMTAGAQKGARITQAVWNEAMGSTPWLEGKLARFFRPTENGDMELVSPLGGVSITQDQAKQMVALAHQKTAQLRDRVQRTQNDYADDLAIRGSSAIPPKMKGAPKKAAGKIVVTPEDMANAH